MGMCIPRLVLYYDSILGMKHGVGLNMISLWTTTLEQSPYPVTKAVYLD
jgi:hypothetical protein